VACSGAGGGDPPRSSGGGGGEGGIRGVGRVGSESRDSDGSGPTNGTPRILATSPAKSGRRALTRLRLWRLRADPGDFAIHA
ncbi:hypothetical protein Taro_016463, partial [Colocasia esculenta]|nr:hypothetical protein [Colocasia esculenta]